MITYRTCVLGIIVCFSLAGLALDAVAQNNGGKGATVAQPRVAAVTGNTIGDFAVDTAAGMPGAAIPLRIRLPASLNDNAVSKVAYTFVMFKGIPERFALTSGFQTRNTWIVSISDTRDLKITIPQGFQGTFYVDAYLYQGENMAPGKCVFEVRISTSTNATPTSADYAAAPSSPPAQDTAAPPAKENVQLSKEEEEALFAQGEAQLENGNVIYARLMFEELVSHGNVRGLFALAKTYDPVVLRQLGVVGIPGDPEKAKELYRKASEFAGTPASENANTRKR